MGHRLRHGGRRALSDLAARQRFILAETRLAPVPFVPEIQLHQADEATALWHRTEHELGAIDMPPPFWAFAWAGGRGLARYLLDNPGLVAGRSVLDFASGSGLVAIAAAMAGASQVNGADIDPFAGAALSLNAAANRIAIEAITDDLVDRDIDADVMLAGDIFYDRRLTERALPWLRRLAVDRTVLVGDPGRAYCPRDAVVALVSFDVPVEPALEEGASKRVTILRILPKVS